MYYFMLKFMNGKYQDSCHHVRYPDSAIVPIPIYPMTSIPEVCFSFLFYETSRNSFSHGLLCIL